jgi:hypothetical protein
VELQLYTVLISVLGKACSQIHAPAALYSEKKGMIAYLWDERLGGLQSQPGKGAEEKNYFICRKSLQRKKPFELV